MPIWLRKYTFSLIRDHYDEEKKNVESASQPKGQQNLVDSSGKVSPPQFKQQTSYK